jgi:membrane-associated phospholipid phosphatase
VYSQRRNVVVAQLAVIAVASAVKLLKFLLPFRHAPLNSLGLGLRLPFGVDPFLLSTSNSFPSGHAALFVTLSIPLWMRSRWLGAGAAVWILLALSLPLLFMGDHWPSDIVAGAAAGIALMLLLCRIIGATRLPDRVLHFSTTHSPAFFATVVAIILLGAVQDEREAALCHDRDGVVTTIEGQTACVKVLSMLH